MGLAYLLAIVSYILLYVALSILYFLGDRLLFGRFRGTNVREGGSDRSALSCFPISMRRGGRGGPALVRAAFNCMAREV